MDTKGLDFFRRRGGGVCVSDRWFKLVQVSTRLLLGLVLEFSIGTQGIVKDISIMKSYSECLYAF